MDVAFYMAAANRGVSKSERANTMSTPPINAPRYRTGLIKIYHEGKVLIRYTIEVRLPRGNGKPARWMPLTINGRWQWENIDERNDAFYELTNTTIR